jgi:ribonuclease D
LIELVIWVASHLDDPLTDYPNLPRHITRGRFVRLQKSIRKAHKIPESEWPEIRKPKLPPQIEPDLKQAIHKLQAECSKIAQDLRIAPPTLAPRAALGAIAKNRPADIDEIMACGLMRWQARVLQPKIHANDLTQISARHAHLPVFLWPHFNQLFIYLPLHYPKTF